MAALRGRRPVGVAPRPPGGRHLGRHRGRYRTRVPAVDDRPPERLPDAARRDVGRGRRALRTGRRRQREDHRLSADLSATHPLPEAPWHEPGAVRSVRGVLMHVIAETAQHAGHADILRETLDSQKST
ncbi:mycothiol transferase [Streptomyces phaeochromogenes]